MRGGVSAEMLTTLAVEPQADAMTPPALTVAYGAKQ